MTSTTPLHPDDLAEDYEDPRTRNLMQALHAAFDNIDFGYHSKTVNQDANAARRLPGLTLVSKGALALVGRDACAEALRAFLTGIPDDPRLSGIVRRGWGSPEGPVAIAGEEVWIKIDIFETGRRVPNDVMSHVMTKSERAMDEAEFVPLDIGHWAWPENDGSTSMVAETTASSN
ncbi:hypothetical protein D3877_29115 [Azospirillum cavernae]|uniref:Uncharacterized protein n=1 Tax=Azospirillum cavernae TaxID=2320860 RepID=A0A418VJX8_9PROT|nr:hypothetical protein [Azospirillum cavernae]RJF76448.1 hypothetical protein D3877_29115 [Azospirillum cavernae]